MIRGRTQLTRMLMTSAVVVAGTLLLAPTTGFARNAGSAASNTHATVSSSSSAQGKVDTDDMTRSSTSVSGNVAAQTNPDADDTMRLKDRDDMKARADADDVKKGTDANERSARTNTGSRSDRDDRASTSRSSRFANSNGRDAMDRDRGLDRAEDRRSSRGFFHSAAYRHHHRHHHVAFFDRDRDRDDMRTAPRDRDDMTPPSGH